MEDVKMTNLILSPNRISRDFDRIFNDLCCQTPFSANAESGWSPRVNITENDERVKLEFDLPGMDREDIKVTVKDGLLTVSGERKVEKKEENENSIRNELFTGQFSRSFTLSDSVDAARISADYKNGQLTLALPKTEKAKPKQIDVKIS